jgi:hypothetical protein
MRVLFGYFSSSDIYIGVWLDVTIDKHRKHIVFEEIELHLPILLNTRHLIARHNWEDICICFEESTPMHFQ